jgi:LacI family transcriptional regulator
MAVMKGKPHRVTLADVARASGFSASTVSIVLNDAPLSRFVATKTKERIRKTAQSMGYHPNAFARSLRSRRSHSIGVLIFDISDPFCMAVLRGIEETLHSTLYLPIIMDAENRRQQFEGYLDLLMERRVEGMVILANWLFADIDPLSRLDKSSLPTIVIGRDLTARSIHSVISDNEVGGYAAIEHLYELGHRKIAVLRGPEAMDDSEKRWRGIERFVAEHRLTLDPQMTPQLPSDLDPGLEFKNGERLITELLQAEAKFTAVVAFDDLTALGAIRGLWKAGRRVPEDCSVVGFDDVPPASLVTPGLTTIHQPLHDMGSFATKFILNAIESGEFPAPAKGEKLLHLMPPTLVERDSTSRIR